MYCKWYCRLAQICFKDYQEMSLMSGTLFISFEILMDHLFLRINFENITLWGKNYMNLDAHCKKILNEIIANVVK